MEKKFKSDCMKLIAALRVLKARLGLSEDFVEGIFVTNFGIRPEVGEIVKLSRGDVEVHLPILDGMNRLAFAIHNEWPTEDRATHRTLQ